MRRWIAAAGLLVAADGAARDLVVVAWLPTTWDWENSASSFREAAAQLWSVSPVWYWIAPDDGVLARLPGGKAGRHVGDVEAEVRAVCRRHGIRLIPLISNSSPGKGFDAGIVSRMLNDPDRRRSHVRALASLVEAHGYDGIEIDYELMKGSDRDAFSRFIVELAEAIHALRRLLAIAVHPKTAEPGDEWGPMTQDWAVLGKAVDSFRVMTYDHHWATGPAGPLAPLPWFEEVLAFAARTVPRHKVLMGLPTYGYDWTGSRTGRSVDVTARDAPALAARKGGAVRWDGTAGEPTFTYQEGDGEHIVWYEDVRCLPAKVRAVRRAGVGGVAVWRLGSEEPGFWKALAAAGAR